MKLSKTFYAANREEWRLWLEQNYATENEIWLIFYKKQSGKASVPYDDAVEEALCFGWIDSIMQRIDEEKYAQKFTPRTNNAKWSLSNKKRVVRMIRAGKMKEVGLAKVTFPLDEDYEAVEPPKKGEPEIPDAVRRVLMSNPTAWENFNKLAPSYRRQYIGWITSARREETQVKRAEEAVERLKNNLKLGMK